MFIFSSPSSPFDLRKQFDESFIRNIFRIKFTIWLCYIFVLMGPAAGRNFHKTEKNIAAGRKIWPILSLVIKNSQQ